MLEKMDRLFHTGVNMYQWEHLLAQITGQTKEDVIKTTRKLAWNVMRRFEIEDMPNVGFIYAHQLLEQIEDAFYNMLGTDISVEHDPEYCGGYLLLNLHEVKSYKDYQSLLGDFTFLDEHLWSIEHLMPYLYDNKSDVLSQVRDRGIEAMVAEYSLSDEAIEALELDMDIEYMPKQLRDAIGAAYLLKAFIDEQTADCVDTSAVEVSVDGIQVTLIASADGETVFIEYLSDIMDYIEEINPELVY